MNKRRKIKLYISYLLEWGTALLFSSFPARIPAVTRNYLFIIRESTLRSVDHPGAHAATLKEVPLIN